MRNAKKKKAFDLLIKEKNYGQEKPDKTIKLSVS
jgi:hypothetical protein